MHMKDNNHIVRTKPIQKNKINLRIVIALLFILTVSSGFAQTRSIRGKVVDESNIPIIGATVVIPGTSKGSLTDVEGAFTIEVASDAKTIQVTYVGYHPVNVALGNQTVFDIIMKENTAILDEVMVVGYGTQKKATLTGAVSSVGSKELALTKNPEASTTTSTSVG